MSTWKQTPAGHVLGLRGMQPAYRILRPIKELRPLFPRGEPLQRMSEMHLVAARIEREGDYDIIPELPYLLAGLTS